MDDALLRRRLREAADAHRPDRARILARVERGMAEPPPVTARRRQPTSRWARTVAVACAVAGVLTLGAVTATVLHRGPAPAATTSAPHALRAAGTIDPGSNRWWAQSNVTVTASAPLTSLVVELRIARTGGIASTGHWRTRPAQDFTVSVREEPTALVYRWTLAPGRTVPPGSHVFAGQYNHAEGPRDASGDAYTITATDAHGEESTVRGDFTPSS
jgi:hypothetical protein